MVVSKFRQSVFFGKWRKATGSVLRELCRWKEFVLDKGRTQQGHIHLLLSGLPGMFSGFSIGYLKGKSAVRILHERGGVIVVESWPGERTLVVSCLVV